MEEQLPVSEATSGTWKALRQQPYVRAGVVTAMMDAVAGSTRQGDEAAELLREILEPYGVEAVTMYSSSADDSLRFVGQVGVPGDLISPWRSIPPSTNIPYVVTVVENRALFFGDRQSRFAQFPALASVRSGGYEGIATIPVEDAGSVLGVVGLMWSQPQEFDELRQHGITKHVQRVGSLLMRNVAATDPELDWLNTLLRLHLDPWLLLEAITNSQGIQPRLRGTGRFHHGGRRTVDRTPTAGDLAVLGRRWHRRVSGHPGPRGWLVERDSGRTLGSAMGIPGSLIRAVRLGQRGSARVAPGSELTRRKPRYQQGRIGFGVSAGQHRVHDARAQPAVGRLRRAVAEARRTERPSTMSRVELTTPSV